MIKQAELIEVLAGLPDGLQTPLGEGGGLVSSGEGQRVRLARALLRPGVRLVVLDEPFRGLGRTQRRELLARARQTWQDATLLCITHDVSETQNFERVLVMADGHILEDGSPAELSQQLGSRYQAMLADELVVHAEIWGSREWKREWMVGGKIVEEQEMKE